MEKQVTINNKSLSLRGREFQGTVTSDKMMDTVTVEWPRRRYVSKYQRYEKRRSKVKAHNPKEIDAKQGDLVKVQETRPISKTKAFIVTEVLVRAGEEVTKTPAPKKAAKKAAKTATKKAVKKDTSE